MKITKILIIFVLLVFAFLNNVFSKTSPGIYLNFDQIEIKTLVKFISKELGKNVIYDEGLRGKVTIICSKPVSKATAWRMISEALSLIGAVVYEEGGYLKIVSKRHLREQTPSVGKKPPYNASEPYILIYTVNNLNPTKIIRIIKPLLSSRGMVYHLEGTPILIFKDTGENLIKIKNFLDTIQKEPFLPKVKIFQLKYASVEKVYRAISPILHALSIEKGTSIKVSKDPEANVLIVYGNEAIFQDIQKLLEKLDIPNPQIERNFYVVHLKYASADEIAKLLKTLNLRQIVFNKKKGSSLRNEIRIAADKSSNSLIIYASKDEFERIKSLIDRLDVRRKQVLIATTIVEISFSKLKDLGIHWQAFGKYGGAAFGGVSETDIYSAINQGKLVIGALSNTGKNISIGGINLFFPDLLFLFSLLEESSSFRILSNPKILTLDNKKAEISVGESVPYTTGITYTSNSLPTVSFEYKDVGLKLVITPHIAGNTVKLEINQTIQEVTQVYRATQGTIDFVAPVTSKREITSEVMVDNGQTIILGGLVSRKTKKSASHVPGISSVPLLGHLFKRTNSQEDKTTLFVFITPYIISSPEELKKLTEEHKLLSEDLRILMDYYSKQHLKSNKNENS